MRVNRSTGTIWLTRAPTAAIAPRHAQGPMWLRAAAIAAAAATLAAITVSAGAPAGAVADAAMAAERAAERAAAKEAARLPRWKGQNAAAAAPTVPTPAEPARAFEILDPRPAGAEGRFALAAAETGSLQPASFAPRPAFAADSWRHGSFEAVAVLDGRTFAAAGGLRVRLADLEVPGSDEACRTLDGRLESCAARAATQLELLTRSRTLSCRYRADGGADEVVGECRLGGVDLSERLLRTGYFRRPSSAPRAAEGPGIVGRS